ncbi:protocadherin gamma-C5-like isoform X33 [Electrophorus electricus]|uniref:Cadherin domain-containing protein n=1 Tax=Electrophorus electricus TaxID=8005 RepID=A0A4W4DT36_ELEEL|nr:protocadherin gamma-C5-like isoform X33 [Electrophorus electricus]
MNSKVMYTTIILIVVSWIVLQYLFFGVEASELLYSVAEESKPGTVVGHMSKDLGMDVPMIIYRELRIVSESNVKYFEVDLKSGALVMKRAVDRESACGPSLSCHIRTQIILHNPMELHHVTVEIVDVNDNAPVFENNNTSLEVSEAAAPGTTFRLASAHDPDVGLNSLRSYALSQNDCFILRVETKSDGSKLPVLVLSKPLDREVQNAYRLILTAVDGGKPERSGTVVLFLNVLDVNDNAPVFDKPGKRVTLLENSPPGTLVIALNSSDADHGLNREILYSFDKYTLIYIQNLFSIDPVTGEIRVTGLLDHEQARVYDITIQARDRGIPAMEGSCNIKVEIIDINDNTPVISISSLSHKLREDVKPGTAVATLSVKDEDAGGNGEVSVRIPSELPFKISHSFEGHYTIMTDGSLDREVLTEYTITVTATDSGSPPRSSQESFVIYVSDVNDNAPAFPQPSYSVAVAENNVPNTPLLTMSASDPDVGENSTLSFSIVDADVHGSPMSSYVYISPDKGQIYALRALDCEHLNVLQVVVQVQDHGSPAYVTNTTVHVFIIDQNDHPPRLLYPVLPPDGTLHFLLPSPADTGHLVSRVTFVDGDSEYNAWLLYGLSGPDAALFHIGAHTGELRTARKLEPEKHGSVFSLMVHVQDNGRPALSTTVAVNITVTEKTVDDLSERRSSPSRMPVGSARLALYLIVTLSCIIAVSVVTVAVVMVRWLACHGYLTSLMDRVSFMQALRQQPSQDLRLQLNTEGPVRYMEVVGGPQDHHMARSWFSTSSSQKDFVFIKAPQGAVSASLSRRLFGSSFMKQKPPNNDWRLPPNQRPGPSGAAARPEEAGPGAVVGTGPWPNPPTEAEQLQALMAAANVSEATATLGPRYNAQYVPDYRQNVYIPGSTATLTANPQQQQVPQQALPPPQALPPAEAPKAAPTPASKKKVTKKDKK